MKMIIRKKKKRHIILKLILIIIFGIILSLLLIKYFSDNINPGLMIYAEDEVTRLTTLVISNSINDEFIDEIGNNNIFDIIKNDSGEIQLISYNTKKVNELLNSVAIIVQNNLKAIENGNIEFLDISEADLAEYDITLLKQGIICKIPFSAFLNNSLLSNIGPKIPVRFTLIGDVSTKIKTDVKEYGINNALLQVSIEISVDFRVNLPFISNKINVSDVKPISLKIIQGNIPNYYAGGLQSSFGIISYFDDV